MCIHVFKRIKLNLKKICDMILFFWAMFENNVPLNFKTGSIAHFNLVKVIICIFYCRTFLCATWFYCIYVSLLWNKLVNFIWWLYILKIFTNTYTRSFNLKFIFLFLLLQNVILNFSHLILAWPFDNKNDLLNQLCHILHHFINNIQIYLKKRVTRLNLNRNKILQV